MSDFQKQALSAFKSNLAGLPSFCRLVMYEIFEYIDFPSGTISINSLEKLSIDDFQVTSLRGRQKEVINGDTIRNALRTIKKAKPDHFKFTTVNQQIVIEIPFLRELYQAACNKTSEVAAVLAVNVDAATTLTHLDESIDLEAYRTGDVTGELAAASLNDAINAHDHAHAKIKPNLQPNNNTKTLLGELPSDLKTSIADDFYPSQFIIDKALSLGMSKVLDASEIHKFILFNKASGSRWANFDYVYLTWLQHDAEREQKMKALQQQTNPQRVYQRSDCNEQRNSPVIKSEQKPTVEDALRANSDAIAPWECVQPITFNNSIDAEYFMGLDSDGGNLRTALRYQTRCP